VLVDVIVGVEVAVPVGVASKVKLPDALSKPSLATIAYVLGPPEMVTTQLANDPVASAEHDGELVGWLFPVNVMAALAAKPVPLADVCPAIPD
jgi:hypothetical protein